MQHDADPPPVTGLSYKQISTGIPLTIRFSASQKKAFECHLGGRSLGGQSWQSQAGIILTRGQNNLDIYASSSSTSLSGNLSVNFSDGGNIVISATHSSSASSYDDMLSSINYTTVLCKS